MGEVAASGIDWSSILNTAIGAGLGFGLGMFATYLQNRSQRKEAKKDVLASAGDALNRLNQAAGLNIEALAMIEIGLTKVLRQEVEKMKAGIEHYYDNPGSIGRSLVFMELMKLSESYFNFYKSFQPLSMMAVPDYKEFSPLLRLMPALTTYVHRGVSAMQEINTSIELRNNLIREHAIANSGEGMTEERHIYDYTMLNGVGEGICVYVEDAMDLFRLTMDQIAAYTKKHISAGEIIPFALPPAVLAAMPVDEKFPELRRQLRTFDHLPNYKG